METETAKLLAKHLKKRSGTGPLDNIYSIHSYDLFHDPSESRLLLNALNDIARSFLADIDCLVPIPKSGIAIASFLHYQYGKPIIFLDNTSNTIIEKHAKAKVCLVDTCIGSSGSFAWASGDLEKKSFILDRIIVLMDNDLYQHSDSRLLDLRNNGKVASLCKASEVLKYQNDRV